MKNRHYPVRKLLKDGKVTKIYQVNHLDRQALRRDMAFMLRQLADEVEKGEAFPGIRRFAVVSDDGGQVASQVFESDGQRQGDFYWKGLLSEAATTFGVKTDD